MEGKGDNVAENMEKLSSDIQEIYEYQIDLKYVQYKPTELEEISRRSNLRIERIKETKGERWGYCKEKFQDMFGQRLRLDGIEIEPATEENIITETVILTDLK